MTAKSFAILNDPLLKPEEAAELLCTSAKLVRQWCAANMIRCELQRSPGGRNRYFIPKSAIVEFREQRTQPVNYRMSLRRRGAAS